eukprot:3530058-Rhodomonas_salina.5
MSGSNLAYVLCRMVLTARMVLPGVSNLGVCAPGAWYCLLSPYARAMRCPMHIGLRACYAESGTDRACVVPESVRGDLYSHLWSAAQKVQVAPHAESGTEILNGVRSILRALYTMSGTERAYGHICLRDCRQY